MTISAKLNNIPVTITDTIKDARRGTLAVVYAIEGAPFKQYTHGGWCDSSRAVVPVVLLTDIRRDGVAVERKSRCGKTAEQMQANRAAWGVKLNPSAKVTGNMNSD